MHVSGCLVSNNHGCYVLLLPGLEVLHQYPCCCREADRDLVLYNGLRIPKGTIIWMPPCAIHATQFNYVDPDRFWPERWDNSDSAPGPGLAHAGEKGAAAAGARAGASAGEPTPTGNSLAPARSFMPFSYGPHDCIGQALANAEGRAMLAMLCSRFEFAVAPCMGTPEDVRAAEVNRLTTQAGNGVWLLLKARGGMERE
jgi:cytochrome P450